MMETPYVNALTIPLALVGDLFVKNDTVIGIIGKTQGVRSATNPNKNPVKKIEIKPLSADLSSFFSEDESSFFFSIMVSGFNYSSDP